MGRRDETAVALVAGRLLSGQLVGIGAAGPPTYIAIVAAFVADAMAALRATGASIHARRSGDQSSRRVTAARAACGCRRRS
jgi:hypothetical protein